MPTGTVAPAVCDTLRRVQAFAHARQVPCYLVGGLLRDQLLGRSPAYLNIDLAVPHNALAVSRALAEWMSGAFVPLDEAAGSARVVVRIEGTRVELDVSEFRGATLEEDLRRRDFTINALAIGLDTWLQHPDRPDGLIDPLRGRQALERKQLIACGPETFHEDPVRILRAFRFASQLDFAVDPAAHPLMRRAVSALADVSGERIRDELLAIFETHRASAAITSLDELGALDVLLQELSPGRGMTQGDFHHLDVLGHQLETVAQLDRLLVDFAELSQDLREPLVAYCAQELVERRSRRALLKLAGLLHDVGKPAHRQVHADGEIWFLGHEHGGAELVRGIVERLRLSNREGEMVCQLVRHHLRPGFLSREPQLTRRAIYRFFKELGDHGPACLVVWWADRMATRGPKSRLDQLDQQRHRLEELLSAYFFQTEEVVKPRRLVDGHRIMQTFGLTPGPLIGKLLEAVEEAQAEGRIRSSEEALALIREHLEKRTAS